MTRVREAPTTRGTARLHQFDADLPRALLVLGHGAGGGVAAPDLVALSRVLPGEGVSVWLVEQPWRVAGRRVAPAPAVLDDAWRQSLVDLAVDLPLVVGGRSAGARVACRTAATVGATAVVALSFPLHPPGRPGPSRSAELDAVSVPIVVVQGRSDPFGHPDEITPAPARRVVGVQGDHSLRTGTASGEVTAAVQAFLADLVG